MFLKVQLYIKRHFLIRYKHNSYTNKLKQIQPFE